MTAQAKKQTQPKQNEKELKATKPKQTLEGVIATACEGFAKKTQESGDTLLKVAYRVIKEGEQWHDDMQAYCLDQDRFSAAAQGTDAAKKNRTEFLQLFMSHSQGYNDALRTIEANADMVSKRRAQEFIHAMHTAAVYTFKAVVGVIMFCEKNDTELSTVNYLDRRHVIAVTDNDGEQHKLTLAQCRRLIKRESDPDAGDDPRVSKATLVDVYKRLREILPNASIYEQLPDVSDTGNDRVTLFAIHQHVSSILPDATSDEYDRLQDVLETERDRNGKKAATSNGNGDAASASA